MIRKGKEITIQKVLSKEASPEERMQFFKQLEQDEELKREYLELRNLWAKTAPVYKLSAKEKERAFDQVWRRTKAQSGKPTILLRMSRYAALFILAFLLGGLAVFFVGQQSPEVSIESRKQQFSAGPNSLAELVLSDGSRVVLNAGSELIFQEDMGTGERLAELKGEAYFEVISNKQVPMLVETDHLSVKVYGTKFNVNAFADEEIIETTLVEGKVTMIPANERKEYALEPGYAAQYRIDGNEITAWRVEDMDAFTGWKDGKLLFRNEQFSDIVNDLERWYNVDIELKDPSLGRLNLYATFVDESIEQVFTILSSSIPIKVDYPARKRQADGSYARRKIVVSRDHNRIIN